MHVFSTFHLIEHFLLEGGQIWNAGTLFDPLWGESLGLELFRDFLDFPVVFSNFLLNGVFLSGRDSV